MALRTFSSRCFPDCYWMLPAGLWSGLVLTAIVIVLIFILWRKKCKTYNAGVYDTSLGWACLPLFLTLVLIIVFLKRRQNDVRVSPPTGSNYSCFKPQQWEGTGFEVLQLKVTAYLSQTWPPTVSLQCINNKTSGKPNITFADWIFWILKCDLSCKVSWISPFLFAWKGYDVVELWQIKKAAAESDARGALANMTVSMRKPHPVHIQADTVIWCNVTHSSRADSSYWETIPTYVTQSHSLLFWLPFYFTDISFISTETMC